MHLLSEFSVICVAQGKEIASKSVEVEQPRRLVPPPRLASPDFPPPPLLSILASSTTESEAGLGHRGLGTSSLDLLWLDLLLSCPSHNTIRRCVLAYH